MGCCRIEFGISKDGNRVSIFNAKTDELYRCQCCKEILIQKRGSQKVWHFAHKTLQNCVDYYDNKGEWHRKMQELFPENNREVYNGEYGKHFFDVLTDEQRIIEFQHSPISRESFDSRTYAYCDYAMDYGAPDPVWVFDYSDRAFNVYHYEQKNNGRYFLKIRWFRPSKIFGDYRCKIDGYELWFRIRQCMWVDYAVPDYERETFYVKVFGVYGNKIYGEYASEEEFARYMDFLKLRNSKQEAV